jgi:glycosyltransferase involved in cell wall biosynthesis
VTIDIMLPYYGDPALMRETVRSVQAQEDGDWRLTVVDDCYPDDSVPGWFASLGDVRITYRRNEHNLGINRNFQQCVELAEHDHLVMIGSDDVILPNYVGTMRAILADAPDATIVQPGVQIVDAHGNPSRSLVDDTKHRLYRPKFTGRTVLKGEPLAVSLLRGNWLYFPALCWRTKAVQAVGFREGMNVIHDLALVIDLVQQGGELVVDDTVCFQYRRHEASVSSLGAAHATRFVEESDYFVEVAERMRAQGWPRAARVAHNHVSSRLHALTMLPGALRGGQRDGARTLLRHAFGPSKRATGGKD